MIVFNKAAIRSICVSVPKQYEVLESQVDTFYQGNIAKLNRIKKTIGLDKRHIATKDITTLDLCLNSAKELLSNDIAINALIFITQTPDYLQPNNAHLAHQMLGLGKDCLCLDVNQGCSGYVYGLYLAFMMIENGFDNVLLCAGDTMSKVVDSTDSNTAPLFGDAGSATIIFRRDSKSYFNFSTYSSGFNHIMLPNSAFRDDETNAKFLYMNGAEVFNFSISCVPENINELLKASNIDIKDIEVLFLHQANAYIIQNIARKLGIESLKAPSSSIAKYANTSSSSIPLAICDYLENKHIDSKVLLSGFGVGLSVASAILELAIQEPKILFY